MQRAMKNKLIFASNAIAKPEYHYTYEDDGENSTPIITLEVMSDSSNAEHCFVNYNTETETQQSAVEHVAKDSTGTHFLMDKTEEEFTTKVEFNDNTEQEPGKDNPKVRNDLLEYMTRNDGSVICKLCGEILQSRTHWYRHKYKFHVIQPLNPAPLFQCEQCLVYFKSRKGYIGHIASRHSDILSDASPVLTNTQAEAITKEKQTIPQISQEVKEESDPEMSIPKTSVPNYQTTVVKQTSAKSTETKKLCRPREQTSEKGDWERRSREEKLVADIIDRVRKECEAQGPGGAARRGYTRRTTVMHT